MAEMCVYIVVRKCFYNTIPRTPMIPNTSYLVWQYVVL